MNGGVSGRSETGAIFKTDQVEFPMAGFTRAMLDGALETLNDVVAAALRTLRGETKDEFKEGVDVLVLLVDSAKQVGAIETMFKVDDEARKVAKK